ncbi:reverse transcriptase-like protein [Elysia marginata]|uniref:Reverse transcriptase-like protein n=1 Tax=Elysia marginata TaxID=1093978 RepID=A0AAV4IFM3_9GAST|nr:reverse transcriptase-like protein [Elysia marginata]
MFQCLETLAPFIADVINQSLAIGTVPDCYKHAIVKPMLKKRGLDENALKNFRPISNLKFLSKILEKLVLKQLLEHLNKSKLNEVFQSAYKAFHSTETALLKVTSDVLESMDQKEICVMTLLDLSAAFNTIDRNILLTRLNQTFGLSGTVLQWFESYLSNRTQSVFNGDHTSRKLPLVFGVPQGSVLGPILFTLYTSPLSSIIKLHGMSYHLYADDTQMYCTDTINNLPLLLSKTSICIESVKEWMMTNKLKLNDDKTEISWHI